MSMGAVISWSAILCVASLGVSIMFADIASQMREGGTVEKED